MPRWILVSLFSISGMLITSVIFFSFVVYSQQKQISLLSHQFVTQPSSPAIAANGEVAEQKINQLQDRIDLLSAQVSSLSSQLNRTDKTSQKSVAVPKATDGVKEYSLYLGSGSSVSREWLDINSALLKLDTSKYTAIKEIRFEAALSILGGEVSVRLKNKTTGGVYYDSTMSHNTSASTWKTSSPISLPSGEFEYVVQLKSSSGELAKLDGSRIKIILN